MRAVRAHLAGPRLLKRRACVEPHTFHLAVPWESPHFYIRTSVLLRRYKVHVLPTRVPTCQLTLKKNILPAPDEGSEHTQPASVRGGPSLRTQPWSQTYVRRSSLSLSSYEAQERGHLCSVFHFFFWLWGEMARGVYFLFFLVL